MQLIILWYNNNIHGEATRCRLLSSMAFTCTTKCRALACHCCLSTAAWRSRGSATFRQHHMPALAQYAEVIAFDRRAAGVSETPATGYSFASFVADIFALLDISGISGPFSWGPRLGPQVLQAALTDPARVIALVLGSTATQTVRVPPELATLVTSPGRWFSTAPDDVCPSA